jgi:hypothetical protein
VLDAMKNSERLRSAFDAYMYEGKPLKDATHDEKLNEYYESLAAVIQHPDVPADEKASYEARRKMVFRLRHPELNR